jgi:hypothetical protein
VRRWLLLQRWCWYLFWRFGLLYSTRRTDSFVRWFSERDAQAGETLEERKGWWARHLALSKKER